MKLKLMLAGGIAAALYTAALAAPAFAQDVPAPQPVVGFPKSTTQPLPKMPAATQSPISGL